MVDCVNGPGVKIYSNSMASGIVGFFSTDGIGSNESNGTAGPKIGKATENIILNIDRRRNYAQILTAITMLPVFSATATKRHVAELDEEYLCTELSVRGNMDG